MAVLAAAVLSFFGATQSTHPGFRAWVAAQWLLAAGVLLDTAFGARAFVAAAGGGADHAVAARRPVRHARAARTQASVDSASGRLVPARARRRGGGRRGGSRRRIAARSIAAFSLCAFVVMLYSAIVTSRLGDFKRSFALKALFAMEATIAAVEARASGWPASATMRRRTSTPIGLVAHLAAVASALGLVPIALAPDLRAHRREDARDASQAASPRRHRCPDAPAEPAPLPRTGDAHARLGRARGRGGADVRRREPEAHQRPARPGDRRRGLATGRPGAARDAARTRRRRPASAATSSRHCCPTPAWPTRSGFPTASSSDSRTARSRRVPHASL